MENGQEGTYIDVTPTWEAVMPIFLTALESGTDEGKSIARAELMRLARIADSMKASKNPVSTDAQSPASTA